MFDEIAFDPKAFQTPRDLGDVVKAFGFHTGRLLPEFPDGWKAAVEHELSGLPDISRAAVQEHLVRLAQHALVACQFHFDKNKSWPANALAAIGKSRLTNAVVARGSDSSLPDFERFFDSLEARHACDIEMTLQGYEEACRRLIAAGPRVVIVDQYFDPSSRNRKQLLEKFLRQGEKGRCDDFDIVASAEHVLRGRTFDEFASTLGADLSSLSMPRLEVRCFFLEPEQSKRLLHDRFMLTAKGALMVGRGFEVSHRRLVTTVATATQNVHRRLCDDFLEPRQLAPELVFSFKEWLRRTRGASKSGRP